MCRGHGDLLATLLTMPASCDLCLDREVIENIEKMACVTT
jgi:hypothetical protein